MPPSPYFAPEPPKGRSTGATIAIVIAVVVVVGVFFVGIVAAIAIPSLMRARAAANEASAIGTLRVLASAEATYESQHSEFGSIREMVGENLLSPEFSDGMTRNSYRFHEVNTSTSGFEFSAEPGSETTAGDRAFNVTDDYVIRYHQGQTAPRGTSGTILGQ